MRSCSRIRLEFSSGEVVTYDSNDLVWTTYKNSLKAVILAGSGKSDWHEMKISP